MFGLAWLVACSGTPELSAPPAEVEGPRTVVVVIGCTLRADRLGAYGNPRNTTPYFDALAAQGTLFEQTLANAPWTRPAIASLITGRYPISVGIDDERDRVNTNRGLPSEVQTLAERFSEAGFKTVGATANPNANAAFNMDQGFDDYHEASALWREDMVKVSGAKVASSLLSYAEQSEGEDLYLQLVVIDTHKPLAPSTAYPIKWGLKTAMQPTAVDRYDAALGYFDQVLEQLDEGLTRLGRSDRVLAIIGDHGEGLETPQWAMRSHGRRLYDANLHVPWLVTGPGVSTGHRVSGLSEGVDLVPTLSELMGLPVGDVHGDSRLAQLQGLDQTHETVAFSETWYSDEHHARWTTPEFSYIRNYAWGKKGSRRGDHELYTSSDGEQASQIEDPQVQALLEQDLEALRSSLWEGRLVWEGEALTDDLEEELKGLGYIDE